MLQAVEHRQAMHHRQANVERHRIGLVLLHQRQRRVAARRDDALEAFLARQVEQDARKVGVVFDDQQHAVARLNRLAVVGDFAVQQQRRIEIDQRVGGVADQRLARTRQA